MAGSHARIQNGIWRDTDFRALTGEAQRLYLLLLSQQDRGHAGTLTLAIPRWASMSADATEESVERALLELHERRFVVVDWSTVEVLVRSTIRHDAVWKQPKLAAFVVTEINGVYSQPIRAALRAELARIPGAWSAEVLTAVGSDDVYPPDAEGGADPHTYPPSKGGTDPLPVSEPCSVDNSETAGPRGIAKGVPKGVRTPTGDGAGDGGGDGGVGPSTRYADPRSSDLRAPAKKRDHDLEPQTASATTAQTLIAEYVDSCQQPPAKRFTGQLAKYVKELLDERIDPDDIRGALNIVRARGLRPGELPNCVEQYRNAGTTRTRARGHPPGWVDFAEVARRGGPDVHHVIDGEVLP